MQTWQERPFVCTSCGYLSAVKSTLTAHIQRFHSGGQRLFKCELCLCAPAGLGPLPLSLALYATVTNRLT